MAEHTCHATGCKVAVPPRQLMCLPHWRMVPEAARRAIWAAYRPGQEIRKDPSLEYLAAARAAIRAVEAAEERRRQRDAWRHAQADLNRDQRNRRGRRPAPEPSGYRLPAPDVLPGMPGGH